MILSGAISGCLLLQSTRLSLFLQLNSSLAIIIEKCLAILGEGSDSFTLGAASVAQLRGYSLMASYETLPLTAVGSSKPWIQFPLKSSIFSNVGKKLESEITQSDSAHGRAFQSLSSFSSIRSTSCCSSRHATVPPPEASFPQ